MLYFALFIFAAAQAAPNSPRIIGGNDALIADFPHHAAIEYAGFFICAGAIISPKFVLTAASCTNTLQEDRFTVRVGTSTLHADGKVVPVKVITQHPAFKKGSMDSDLTVLELDKLLELDAGVQPIALPEAGQALQVGAKVQLSGWGSNKSNSDYQMSLQLQSATLEVVALEVCRKDYENYGDIADVTENMLCTGSSEGARNPCYGDGGNPLVSDGVLRGIYSWSWFWVCGDAAFPAVYADVAKLRDFIQTTTGL